MKRSIVLLHGFCEDHRIWNPIIPGIQADVEIICPDLPGFGENKNPVESISEMALFISAMLDKAKVERYVILGHSLGGYVALEMANRYPEKIVGLGLVHSHAASDSEEKKHNRDRSIEHLSLYGKKQFLQQMTTSLLSPENAENMDLRREVASYLDKNNTTALISTLKAMRDRTDRRELLKEMEKPILWLIGREDSFISDKECLKQSSLCRCTMIEILENSGHLGMMEETEKVQQIIGKFIDWSYSLLDLSSESAS